MAANKFPFAACKVVVLVVVAAVAMISLLFSPAAGAGGEAATTAAQAQELPQCNPMVGPPHVWPDCNTWCWNQGHPGGYVKGDVCCCNSGAGRDLAAES